MVNNKNIQKYLKAKQNFIDFVNNTKDYKIVEPLNYVNNSTKVLMLHEKCKKTFPISPKNFKHGVPKT